MHVIEQDKNDLSSILKLALEEAEHFLKNLDKQTVAHQVPSIQASELQDSGIGASSAFEQFQNTYRKWVSGSAGPRYFGFVTGGATPAALLGDWLASTYDQNLSDAGESFARQLSIDCCNLLRQLLKLDDKFDGIVVSGATSSSTVALASARQWIGHQLDTDIANDGLHRLPQVPVFSGTAHSSLFKALSITGMGRNSVQPVPCLPSREAVDVSALEEKLASSSLPAIVIANAGTVNTCDFDDLDAIGQLKKKYNFWLHVDGAFGAFANASPKFQHLLRGLNYADSVTVDGHKWLNVPYDCGFVFTRHLNVQGQVYNSMAAYLPSAVQNDTFIHLTPENSQRLRALPAWMSLIAYGRSGYQSIVENCCALAQLMAEKIDRSEGFVLLAPVRLNGVCFSILNAQGQEAGKDLVEQFLQHLRLDGRVFLTPSVLWGHACVRGSISNWSTQAHDIDIAWAAMDEARHAVI